jgi:hypothetical protein
MHWAELWTSWHELSVEKAPTPKGTHQRPETPQQGVPKRKNRPLGAAGVNLKQVGFVQTLSAAKRCEKDPKKSNWRKNHHGQNISQKNCAAKLNFMDMAPHWSA